MLRVVAVIAALMEVAAIIMAWFLCYGGANHELMIPFLICFVGGAILLLLMMCTHEFWRAVLGPPPKYPWES